jgi:hypothetical protein
MKSEYFGTRYWIWATWSVVNFIPLLHIMALPMDPSPREHAFAGFCWAALPLVSSCWLSNELRKFSSSPKAFRFYTIMLVLWIAGLAVPASLVLMFFLAIQNL